MNRIEQTADGQLTLIDAQGVRHVGVVPVRAFPFAAPAQGVSLVDSHGHEQWWIDDLASLPADQHKLLESVLAEREFMPCIQAIVGVSGYSTPSTWQVETDHGTTELVLKGEEDIRRLPDGRLIISSANGLQFQVCDPAGLDRPSKRRLDRFL